MATISLVEGFNTMSKIASVNFADSTIHMPNMDRPASAYGIETFYTAVPGPDCDAKQC